MVSTASGHSRTHIGAIADSSVHDFSRNCLCDLPSTLSLLQNISAAAGHRPLCCQSALHAHLCGIAQLPFCCIMMTGSAHCRSLSKAAVQKTTAQNKPFCQRGTCTVQTKIRNICRSRRITGCDNYLINKSPPKK